MGLRLWAARYFNRREHRKNMANANALGESNRAEVARIVLDAFSFHDSRERSEPEFLLDTVKAIYIHHGEMRRQALRLGARNRSDPAWLGTALVETWSMEKLLDFRTGSETKGTVQIRSDLESFIGQNLEYQEILEFKAKDWD